MVTNEHIAQSLTEMGKRFESELAEIRALLKDGARVKQARKMGEADILARELEELAHHITTTKREISLMRGAGSASRPGNLSSANNELDAIVQATEEATNGIMTASETIDAIASVLRDQPNMDPEDRKERLNDITAEVVRIFECCNFQDITGQRISRIVKSLTYIEMRIENMIGIWGVTEGDTPPESLAEPVGDAALLNGPQSPDAAVSQNEIDSLFG